MVNKKNLVVFLIFFCLFFSLISAASLFETLGKLNGKMEKFKGLSLTSSQLEEGFPLLRGENYFIWPLDKNITSIQEALFSLGSSWDYIYENHSERYHFNKFGNPGTYVYALKDKSFDKLISGKTYLIFLSRESALTYPSGGFQDFGCIEEWDNGKDPFYKGYIEYFLKGTLVKKEDFCINTSFLLEYSCEKGANKVETIYCEYDCEKDHCRKSFSKQRAQEVSVSNCEGCISEQKCYDLGSRKSGKYCSQEGVFVNQIFDGFQCNNYYECKSRSCVKNLCTDNSLLKKLKNFFQDFKDAFSRKSRKEIVSQED